MCGIAGMIHLRGERIPQAERCLAVMNDLLAHRGPDGEGVWVHARGHVGFAHRRLSIIDLETGDQPMRDERGNWVTYNGEIYNYRELRTRLGAASFRTHSDTETILEAYQAFGADAVDHFRGMFAFGLWDETAQRLYCGRDRFGIKPFYYVVVGDIFYFASEIKALLPFLPTVETDTAALQDYLTFQFCLEGKTLFKGVRELPAGHVLTLADGRLETRRYWEVYYERDVTHDEDHFAERLDALLEDSVAMHLRSDVPVGAYVSGGLDSSTIAAMASRDTGNALIGFTGRFDVGPEYDESHYARDVADWAGFPLHDVTIQSTDFVDNIEKIVYHLDQPVAGPGSFPQFMVSKLASQHRKVVLGGQGGDETFGGYTRYLMAYFEQCIKAAINGTMHSGNFVVTYESIIPNLVTLQQYQPLLREFWSEGLFEDMDRRYFRLINRAARLQDEVRWDALGDYSPFDAFRRVFHGDNVKKESYFDLMTHFDFKTLLPALLQVEDRVSMAHGLEARVPLLDHPLIEFTATMPSNVKFKCGELKHIFRRVATCRNPFPRAKTRWASPRRSRSGLTGRRVRLCSISSRRRRLASGILLTIPRCLKN